MDGGSNQEFKVAAVQQFVKVLPIAIVTAYSNTYKDPSTICVCENKYYCLRVLMTDEIQIF